MATLDMMVVAGPLLIVITDLIIYLLVAKGGRRSSGKGAKYEPFTGGEEDIAPRGVYQSELFVFAALFMVVDAFALLLAGSFQSPTNYYPLLFLAGGSGVVLVVIWWLMIAGGLNL